MENNDIHGGGDRGEGTDLGRRGFLRTAGAVAASAGVTAGLGAAQSDVPVVTTRDHFEATWYREVERNEDYGPREYETDGSIPGLDEGSPDEIVVFIHGWLNKSPGDRGTFSTARDALRAAGYDQPVVGYSYDADTWLSRWWQATEIAELNGPKLTAFVEDLRAASPNTDVRIIAHSLGARVALSALKADGDDTITSIALLGGAVNDESVATDGRFGDAIASTAARVDNYHDEGDDILEYAYSLAEWDSAVGQYGVEGEAPETYADYPVDVESHFDYYGPENGCIDQVVETF